jgi:tetratricopeptide (TPR) repeat protein
MHDRLADLTERPDVLILYVGHNEFSARFPWMREPGGYYDDDMPALYSPSALTAALRLSPLCRLVLETWDRQRVDLRPPHYATRELIDQPIATDEEYAAILADFGRRLEAIAAYCEKIGTLPVFIIPASNDGGYDPSRSVLAPETPRAEREAIAREVLRARAMEATDPDGALRLYAGMVSRHPEFAETRYRLARLLERRGDRDEARRHYIKARERDGLPVRCPEDFRRAYREVAARHPSVVLVDAPRVLERASEHGILDDRLFHDAQHPNLRGYAAIAQDLLDQLRARRAFGWPEGIGPPRIELDACARHFGLDADRWAQVCRREAHFYSVTAFVRYDPTFRLAREAEYRRAIQAIQAGSDPAEAGIPGWGGVTSPVSPASRPRAASGGRGSASDRPS